MKIDHLRCYYKDRRVALEMDSCCALAWNMDDGNWWWIAEKSEFKHPRMALRDALREAAHCAEDPFVREWLMNANSAVMQTLSSS